MNDRDTAIEHLQHAAAAIDRAYEALQTATGDYHSARTYWKQQTHEAERQLKAARQVLSA